MTVTAGRGRFPIVIIGCGFGGIALAIALKRAGFADITILERASDVGGVWRDNSYPGAACDVVSRLYSFSFDQDYAWSTAFAPQGEILAYIKTCVERHGLRPLVRFNVEVASAAFDEAAARWRITTTDGQRFEAAVLVSAVGLFNHAKLPDISGRSDFAGAQFHSSRWNHAVSLAGKRVAVIGNGASAVQFVPKVAAEAAQLALFLRTPQYVLPKTAFPGTSPLDEWLQRRRWLRSLARLKIYMMFERFIFRRQFFPKMRLAGEEGFRAYLAAKIADPELRRKLTPNYALGCKRLLVSNEFYDALVRPNVEVVDTPIAAIVPEGVRTADGVVRPVDAIVYGTGFTPDRFLTPMRIRGMGGRDLNDVWRDGAEAYLGMTVAGFPNFFMLYGPNTNAIASIIFMLECQANYVVSCIRALLRRGARSMTVRADVQRRFVDEMQRRLGTTVPAMQNCFTYFKSANGRITTNWAGYASEYRWRTRRVKARDFDFIDAA